MYYSCVIFIYYTYAYHRGIYGKEIELDEFHVVHKSYSIINRYVIGARAYIIYYPSCELSKFIISHHFGNELLERELDESWDILNVQLDIFSITNPHHITEYSIMISLNTTDNIMLRRIENRLIFQVIEL